MRAHLAFLALLWSILFAIMSEQLAVGYEAEYLPLSREILNQRFLQRLLQDGVTPADGVVRFGVTSIRVNGNNSLSAFGSDREGKPWTLVADAPSSSVSVWFGDLDKNGCNDLILYIPIAKDDWLPNARVVFLMFERNGRPTPWCTLGFFCVDKYGLKELVDLNGDQRAELILQTRSDRFWITSLFETQSTYWRQIQSIAGHSLPFHTLFTSKANHSIVSSALFCENRDRNTRAAYRKGFSRAEKCDLQENGFLLESIDWCRDEPSSSILTAKKGTRTRISSVLCETMVVVLDEHQGRRIAIGSTNHSRKLLEEMNYRRLQVVVRLDASSNKRSTMLVFARSTAPTGALKISLVSSQLHHKSSA